MLATLPLFSGVGRRQLRKIAGLAQLRVHEDGDLVIRRGDDADGFYLILGGKAKVAGRDRAQRLSTGDYFGEMALLDGEPRSATITAVGELQVMRLPRRAFQRLLKEEPTIAVSLLQTLAARLRATEKRARL